MSKVIVIGIDGLDSVLLTNFKNDLPNFEKLKESSHNIKLKSVFPPDSPTAWTSIYTGMNPAEHGIISFKDPATEFKVCDYLGTDISGKTFWDKAGNAGKKVCVVFPHLGYPVWPVNGVMIGRTSEVDIREFEIQTYPSSLSEKYNLSDLKPMSSYPINIGDIMKPTKDLIINEVNLGLKLLNEVDWDLYFIYFSSLDNIEHLFWMYYDSKDPEYKEGNPYKDVIRDFYKFYDKEVIGKFLEFVDSNTTLIVLSDHGHAMRPSNVVNINEILRREGLLKSKTDNGSKINLKQQLLGNLKNNGLKLINNYRIAGKVTSKILSFFPKSASVFYYINPIDIEKTRAYISDPSGGLKAYSYAGIKLNPNIVSNEYEEVREEVIELISYVEDPITSENIVEWVLKREEVYNGEYLDKYPDILFKLKDDWGVGWEINKDIYTVSHSHKLHSGNHRQKSAVFLAKNLNLEIKNSIELMDIDSIVMSILGITNE